MATFKTSIGGAAKIVISDLSDTDIVTLTGFKGVARKGRPELGAVVLTIDNFEWSTDVNTLIEDYLMKIAPDSITLENENAVQEILYPAEDAIIAASKYFKIRYYGNTNRGSNPLDREVFYALGYLSGDTGDRTSAPKTPVNIPIQITTLAAPVATTFAADDFDSDLVYVAAAETLALGSYGVIKNFPLVNPA